MKTMITGDLHGDFGVLNKIISRKKPDLVICCGDFGYWPNFGTKLSDIKLQSAKKLLWCDGNHENHWALRDRSTDELAPGIIYMPRGSTYTLEDGRTILFMGGADSIDKKYRRLGIDWFPEEIVSQKNFQSLPEGNIDIFVTHTCPAELVPNLTRFYPGKVLEPSNIALSELLKRYKPKLWFFGHWHVFQHGILIGTEWYALGAVQYEDRWWMWLPKK